MNTPITRKVGIKPVIPTDEAVMKERATQTVSTEVRDKYAKARKNRWLRSGKIPKPSRNSP
jgi:hypothetical protein